ncbi:MAG: VWA domain-containing protein [Synergistaceae bacterium]|nr:VWA domain-containing protein [Synergistaceae bacterium]
MSDYVRRLPVYLLLDCSGSMLGAPIEAVKQGIKTLLSELKGDPQALETAYLSVITFESTAQQVVPLTELMQFQEPNLNAGGMTALGGALNVLMDCIKNEVRKSTENQKGDWRPMVFIMTDGYPTDDNELNAAISKLKSMKTANIIACLCGDDATPDFLRKITECVVWMNQITPGAMAAFFKWVSSSIKMTSSSLSAKPGENIQLPPPPSGFTIVP